MRIFATTACVILLSAGLAQAQETSATARMEAPDAKDLGTVTFTQTESGLLHVIIEMTGLPPGPHGFHGRVQRARRTVDDRGEVL